MDDVLANPVAVLLISFELERKRPIFAGRPPGKGPAHFHDRFWKTRAEEGGRRRHADRPWQEGRCAAPGGGCHRSGPIRRRWSAVLEYNTAGKVRWTSEVGQGRTRAGSYGGASTRCVRVSWSYGKGVLLPCVWSRVRAARPQRRLLPVDGTFRGDPGGHRAVEFLAHKTGRIGQKEQKWSSLFKNQNENRLKKGRGSVYVFTW